MVWKKGRCLACASSNWVGVSPRVTCTVRTISLVASEAAAGVAHVVVILIIKTFIQDRAKLCLQPHNIIACFSTSHRARKEKGSQEKEWQSEVGMSLTRLFFYP